MQIKNLAWGFLLENDIEDFRQDLESVIALVKQKGWRIYSYQEKRELLEEFEVVEYAAEHNGFTYVFHQEYIIFYKDELAYNQKIFVIMHEIGHIEAHHTYSGCILGQADTSWKTNEQEQEADIFACECLAPSCILSSMGADTVEKLKRMSLLPDRYNSQQIAEIHRTEGEERSKKAKELCQKYQDYIKSYKKDRLKEQAVRIVRSPFPYIAVIIVMTVLLVASKTFWSVPAQEGRDALQQTVYVTKSGTKYHRVNCGYLKNTDLAITVEQALANGYSPCSICNPPDGQD